MYSIKKITELCQYSVVVVLSITHCVLHMPQTQMKKLFAVALDSVCFYLHCLFWAIFIELWNKRLCCFPNKHFAPLFVFVPDAGKMSQTSPSSFWSHVMLSCQGLFSFCLHRLNGLESGVSPVNINADTKRLPYMTTAEIKTCCDTFFSAMSV